MPRYFFHVFDGIACPDQEGTDLPDLSAAKREALATAVVMLRDRDNEPFSRPPWRMEVADGGGRTLLTIRFSADQPIGASDGSVSATAGRHG